MDQVDLRFASARELASAIASRELSPVELTRTYLEQAERLDPRLRIFITLDPERALAEARSAEQVVASGATLGPLHGLPIAVKDNIATAGIRTTGGSKVLGDWVPDRDAPVVQRLRAAGATVLGKTNMHELAYGGTCSNVHYGFVRNPWNPERVPGGSSGGSGVAVAAGVCAGALGTDTAGSVRLPASQCGVVGLKATYGLVSIQDVVPLAWTLDHVGPMTRTVADAALMLEAMAGYVPGDPTSRRAVTRSYLGGVDGGIQGTRLGVLRGYFAEPLQPDVARAFEAALDVLRGLGADLQDMQWPSARYANSVTWTIILAEAAAYHRTWLRARPDDYGPEVRASLEQGQLLPATDYVQAQRARTTMSAEVKRLLRDVDALVAPMLPITSPRVGQETIDLGGKTREVNPVFIRLADPFNVTGLPALSVPCGFGDDGLPIGLQIAGRAFDEPTVLRIGYAYEHAADWSQRRPPLAT